MLESGPVQGRGVPQLAEFSAFLSARIGLHFPPERHGELAARLESLAHELGQPDPAACMRWLMHTPLQQRTVEALAGQLTIGETYFFREPEVFQAIEATILPACLRARADTRRLRLWSAGCATGEEPYSLAIVLERLGGAIAGWDVTLLATDINTGFLSRARQAVYGNWSFRGVAPEVRARYFTRTADGREALAAGVRERVSFSYLNLAAEGFPSLLSNTTGMDLILCRNVLMYFTAELAAATMVRLRDALVDGGWLLVAGAEAPLLRPPGMRTVRIEGATAFQKTDKAGHAPQASRPAVRTPRPVRKAATTTARRHADVPALATAEQVRRHADAGRLDAARASAARALENNPLDAGLHYLHALIEIEAGQPAQAAQALRKAVFLEPDLAMAHLALAHLALAQRRPCVARRQLALVRALLLRYAADDAVPHAEGMRAGHLAQLVDAMLEQARGRG